MSKRQRLSGDASPWRPSVKRMTRLAGVVLALSFIVVGCGQRTTSGDGSRLVSRSPDRSVIARSDPVIGEVFLMTADGSGEIFRAQGHWVDWSDSGQVIYTWGVSQAARGLSWRRGLHRAGSNSPATRMRGPRRRSSPMVPTGSPSALAAACTSVRFSRSTKALR